MQSTRLRAEKLDGGLARPKCWVGIQSGSIYRWRRRPRRVWRRRLKCVADASNDAIMGDECSNRDRSADDIARP